MEHIPFANDFPSYEPPLSGGIYPCHVTRVSIGSHEMTFLLVKPPSNPHFSLIHGNYPWIPLTLIIYIYISHWITISDGKMTTTHDHDYPIIIPSISHFSTNQLNPGKRTSGGADWAEPKLISYINGWTLHGEFQKEHDQSHQPNIFNTPIASNCMVPICPNGMWKIPTKTVVLILGGV